MSPRRTTVPPTRESSRSARSGRKGLIARETEKQSVRKRTALDNRFHRTDRALSVLLSEGVDRSECDKSLMKEISERDQECGKEPYPLGGGYSIKETCPK